MLDLEAEDYASTFMPVAECAQRMNIGVERVCQLAKLGVLRTRMAGGEVWVQPASVPAGPLELGACGGTPGRCGGLRSHVAVRGAPARCCATLTRHHG